MRRLGFVALLSLMLAGAAQAGNPNSGLLSFNPAARWTQTCNDQESTPGNCVTDTPTVTGGQPCTWGDEDDIADFAYGKLSSGQTISDTLCLVTDPCSDFACPHQVLYTVTGALAVTLTSDRGGLWTATSTSTKTATSLCFNDPLWPQPDPSILPTIAGTNGGYGLLTRYTLTVTATKTTQMSAGFEIAQDDADGRFGYYHQFSNVSCPMR